MNIIVLFFPMIVWMVIVGVIVGVVKANAASRSRARRANYGSRPGASRAQMQRNLSERKPASAKEKSFRKTGFDDYSAKGRKKDVVTGYNKKYSDKRSYRQAAGRQFSHTYDGHEPWDKCMPEEIDPWDKRFRAD